MTVINGTFLSSATTQTANTITVPPDVTPNMVVLIAVANDDSTATTWTYTTSRYGILTNISNGTAVNNTRVASWWGTGFVAGDTITLTASRSCTQVIGHSYTNEVSSIASSAVGTRGGTTQAYTTSGSLTPANGQKCLVIGVDRTPAGVTLTSITSSGGETVTTRDFQHSAASTNPGCGVAFGDFVASAAASRTATVTVSGTSGNGYCALLLGVTPNLGNASLKKSADGYSQTTDTNVSLDTGAGATATGDVCILPFGKNAASDVAGITITDDKGNTYTRRCISNRASTQEATLFSAPLTTALAAGDDIYGTLAIANARKLMTALIFSGISDVPNVTSTNTPQADADTNSGLNGTTSISHSLTTTVDKCLVVIGICCSAQNNTCSYSSPWVAGPEMHTSAGSTFRNLFCFYTYAPTAGSVTFAGTLGSGSYAAAMAAFPVLDDVEPPSGTMLEFGQIIGGVKVRFIEAGIL